VAIDSTSTIAEIEAEYKDTAGYFSANSTALAYRHAIAIGYMLLNPSAATKGSHSISTRIDLLQREKERAENFARFSGGTAASSYVDFRQFRN